MDYSKLPSQLIYRTRKSLEEFTTNNTMNEYLVDNMLDINYLQSSNFKERVTACFNAAYYICTLILVDEHPEWNLPKYYEIAFCNQKNNNVEQAISLSLVRIYLLRFGSEWHEKHKKLVEKLDGFFNTHWIQQGDPFLEDYSYHDAFNNLTSFDVIVSPFTTTEFALRVIDQEAIEEMQIADFTWTQFTDYYKYNIMQDIVFHVGKTEDEMTLLVNSLRHDAENFYSKNNPYYESVCNRLDEIKRDIYFHFHAAENEALMQAEIEELQYQGDVRPLQTRISELEKEVSDLKTQLSDCATDDDVAQIFNDDEQGELQECKQPQTEKLNSESINHPQKLTDALKKIEEQEKTIKDLKETIIRYQKRGLPPAKRKGIALGLTPLQADIFGDYLAEKLGIVFDNKKEELSLILNCLFGHGRSSLANKMHKITGAVDDRLYVASIFGPFSPSTAQAISSDWTKDINAPWEEENNDEGENESD